MKSEFGKLYFNLVKDKTNKAYFVSYLLSLTPGQLQDLRNAFAVQSGTY